MDPNHRRALFSLVQDVEDFLRSEGKRFASDVPKGHSMARLYQSDGTTVRVSKRRTGFVGEEKVRSAGGKPRQKTVRRVGTTRGGIPREGPQGSQWKSWGPHDPNA